MKTHRSLLKEGRHIFVLEIQEDLIATITIQQKAQRKQLLNHHRFNFKKQFQAWELGLMI
jgi:hypothetical protein